MFNITTLHAASTSRRPRRCGWLAVLLLAFSAGPAASQPVTADLSDLVGRIALYPDPLIAIVLPASTYPLQVVQAARFLEDYEYDSSLQPNPDWDDAVIALLNYPEVLAMMNEDLDWTWTLGEEVLYDQDGVLNAVQLFRDRAYAAGNLRSDDRQVVRRNDTVIEVVPVQPEVIYVPYYEPRRVVVYQPAPVIWYYPRAYPVYYYPYPVGYLFPTRHFWGVTTVFSIGWRTRVVHVHHHHYTGHPFFGRPYHVPYYVRTPQTVTNINIRIDNRRGDVWQPASRGGSRPQTASRRDSDSRFTVDSRGDSGRYTQSDSRRDATGRGTDARATGRTEAARTASGSDRINERFDARVATRDTGVATRDTGRETRVDARTTNTRVTEATAAEQRAAATRTTAARTTDARAADARRSETGRAAPARPNTSARTESGEARTPATRPLASQPQRPQTTERAPATGTRPTGERGGDGAADRATGRLAAPAPAPQRQTSTPQTTQRPTLTPQRQAQERQAQAPQPRTQPQQAQPQTQTRIQQPRPQAQAQPQPQPQPQTRSQPAQPQVQPRLQQAQPQSTQRSPSRVTAAPSRPTAAPAPAAPAPAADRGTSRSSTPPARTSNDGRGTVNRRDASNARSR